MKHFLPSSVMLTPFLVKYYDEEPEDEAEEELPGSGWDVWFTESFGEDDLALMDGDESEFRELSKKLSKATRRIKDTGDKYESRAEKIKKIVQKKLKRLKEGD